MEEPLLYWPQFKLAAFIGTIVVLTFILIVYLMIRLRVAQQAQRDAAWLTLATYGLKRKLTQLEMNLLRRLYDSLSAEDRGQILHNKRVFHAKMHDFLVVNRQVEPRSRVQLMDKLFPEIDFQVEIKSLRDIQLGESCSVEFDGHRILGWVVKKTEHELWISLPNWTPERTYIGDAAQIYFFRPNIGGFLVHGSLQRAGRNGLVFEKPERIEFYGDQHLMARMELPIRLTAWAPGGQGPVMVEVDGAPGSSGAHRAAPAAEADAAAGTDADSGEANADAPTSEEGAQRVPLRLDGETDRISDRALIFVFSRKTVNPDRLIRKYEVWEADLTLPIGFRFKCRGRILPGSAPGRYIFRYLDASDLARRMLWEEIKSHGPEREQLV